MQWDGHLDTVHLPFIAPEVQGDNITGSGACDMKGGVAAALDVGPEDSPELHRSDTITAGAGLCDPDAVRVLVTEGPDRVRELTRHPAFERKNPNRMRALIGAFSQGNQVRFHDATGAGYTLLADEVIALDPINPTTAARLVQPLGAWRRHDQARQALMREQLERVLAVPNLSKNTYEMASKSLA